VSKRHPDLVTGEVARAIVAFVSGRSDLDRAEVEPALLTLSAASSIFAALPWAPTAIEADLLEGSRATILESSTSGRSPISRRPARVSWRTSCSLNRAIGKTYALERAQKAARRHRVAPSALRRAR